MRLAEDKAKEAILNYSKKIIFAKLEVSCLMKLSLIHEQFSIHDKQAKVLEYLLKAAAVPGLKLVEQIDCTIQISDCCKRLGLLKKQVFIYLCNYVFYLISLFLGIFYISSCFTVCGIWRHA